VAAHAAGIARVTVPEGRRVIGFGRGAVYTLHRDDDDLQYLERYSYPVF